MYIEGKILYKNRVSFQAEGFIINNRINYFTWQTLVILI